ncbi:mucin-5AC isoform X2 [Maniola jurtina]|uniref:mucin-5AC isoform X2 n=1 Tax=Maniola jurtina TaxID=191418 RepID=UPI001E6880EE|nr:mucin-5AC isoform X2 [Maniola jurtina]
MGLEKWDNIILEHMTWLSLLVALVTLISPALSSSPRVVCYYTNWSVYRPGTAKFNPQNINPYLCTHLVYAFGGFTKDNTLKPFDKYQDIEKGGYAKFNGLKTYNKNLKTILAIGGWNEGSSRFSPMVAAKDRRREFVRNVIKFLRQNHFDGLDLDWEYPAFRDGGKPKDRENYAKLVKELREEFEKESQKTGKPRLLLTMAVPAGIEYIEKGFDVKTLNRYLDWMNLLTYDYHSAFEPAVNHHAPLYPLEEPNEYSVDNELNIDYTIKFYLENGADRDKLVLGIPTYGRSYTLFNADAVEIGSPADGPGEQGDATREKGYLAYYEICEALKPKTKKRAIASDEYSEEEEEEDSEEEEEKEWNIMYPNRNAMGPVAYRGNQWVGYDDIDIVKKKAEYVAENGLGGIMFWSIDNDDFRGTCHGKPYPLIEAAKEAYISKLGTTDLTKFKDTPKITSKSGNRRRNRPKSSSTTSTTTTTKKPKTKSNKRKSGSTSADNTTPSWNIITPEPPTTPDPGTDFKCKEEGFFPHPRDCKKYFWCLDSGPSDLGIVAHHFTCPSGLYFNKAADSCDFARNVLCKKSAATTKAPTKATTAKTTVSTTTTTTTRRPIRLTSKSSLLFRTSTTTTTPEPEVDEEESFEIDADDDASDVEAEDPKVIKELIDLIKKVGGVEQLEKHLKLSESSAGTTDGVATTTPSSFNKKLYQRVLERARGKNKFGGNSITENSFLNSRGGPQNAGLEPSSDKDRLLKKDRPQYTTINRSRPSTSSTTEDPTDSEEAEEESEEVQQRTRLRQEPVASVGTTPKPLQYVNIRRTRPSTAATTETPDDSRNALFERVQPYVAVEESPNSLDIASSRRENVPEYVTIRRSRPTTPETTTAQYRASEQGEESQETVLEREITSQSSQPLYTSVLRTRSTTLAPPEEPNTPEPTTVLSVQISSLLNAPNTDETERLQSEQTQTTVTQATELPEPETTTTSTTTITTPSSTTTSTTSAPSSASTRRNLLRRRGSTTVTSTAAPVSTTQVSSRNYSFIRRRRPLSQPNEISESNESGENLRKVRSTTPDSRELDGVKPIGNSGQLRRFRGRFQTSRPEDSISAAASQVSRGQFRPQLNRDELLSLSPIDIDTSEIIENEEIPENSVKFPSRVTTILDDEGDDSEVSAATIDERRSNTRGRSRYLTTTEALTKSVATESPLNLRRPTFTRFTPRPFGRTVSFTAEPENNVIVSPNPRIRSRLPFGRQRATTSTAAPLSLGRKLPYASRQSTIQQVSTSQIDDDEIDDKNDDISLSESAIEEQEHDEISSDSDKNNLSIPEIITESIPILDSNQDKNAKRKFRVIRRRPATTQKVSEISAAAEVVETTTAAIPRVRKIIRKKIRPTEEEPELTPKLVSFVNAGFKDAPKDIINYGERTRVTVIPVLPTDAPKTTTENDDLRFDIESEILKEPIEKLAGKGEQEDKDSDKNEQQTETPKFKLESPNKTKEKPDVTIETDDKTLDILENRDTDVKSIENDQKEGEINSTPNNQNPEQPSEESKSVTTESKEIFTNDDKDSNSNNSELFEESSTTEISLTETETTTKSSTTQLTSPSPRSRSPYRPPKRLLTSTTESTPSRSRTFSRKYNPGAYTSPATVTDRPGFISRITTRKPSLLKTFTRRTYPTARTTPKYQYSDEEEYSDEELLEEEPESPFAFVPQSQLFTRKPDSAEYEDNAEEEPIDEDLEEPPEDETYEDEQPARFRPTSKKPLFKPKIINSNTFRTTTSTTEIPRPSLGNTLNRTAIYNRFGGNKPVNDTKKRVQNVPLGYTPKVTQAINLKNSTSQTKTTKTEEISTTSVVNENDLTTTESDDYLSSEISTSAPSENTDISSTGQIESVTAEMEVDNSTDDYLEYTTHPSTQDLFTNVQTDTDSETEASTDTPTTRKIQVALETTTESMPEPTTNNPEVSPIIKTQFNKLFSVSRVVEVSSKSEKHRLNKNNETTLIEEGKVMIEKKPTLDKIGEVSRYSLIKIVEDEIPIYLTKLGHVYPVDNPPDNPIRIDEARNARALVDFSDIPKENLVASESMNEAYRHINQVLDRSKLNERDKVEHIFNDDFLSYVNEEKKEDKSEEEQHENWQFVPAAYDTEKNKQNNEAKSFEIVTPRLMLTDPSILPLEALFKTETPMKPRKVSNADVNKPFVVYSAPVPTQEEDASLVKLKIVKPQAGRSIVTFAKGQEFKGAPTVDDSTIIYPFSVSILQQSSETTQSSISTSIATEPSSTTAALPSNSTENVKTSPIVELLTTTQSTTMQTESMQTTESSTQTTPITTETVPEESTTVQISPLEAKRAKFGFPRRPVIRPLNITRLNSISRSPKTINATVTPNLVQKINKTTSFSPSRSRVSGSKRVQNVPVDIRRKFNKTRTFTTESPRTTTERKVVIKPIRPNLRPAFVPRRFTTVATTAVGYT